MSDTSIESALTRVAALARIGAKLADESNDDGGMRALFETIFHQTADILEGVENPPLVD
ncbi:hypothetical protein [Thiomonas sp.]